MVMKIDFDLKKEWDFVIKESTTKAPNQIASEFLVKRRELLLEAQYLLAEIENCKRYNDRYDELVNKYLLVITVYKGELASFS